MNIADFIDALKRATPEEKAEVMAFLVDYMVTHATVAQVEALQTMLQIGDRFTSKPLISKLDK